MSLKVDQIETSSVKWQTPLQDPEQMGAAVSLPQSSPMGSDIRQTHLRMACQ